MVEKRTQDKEDSEVAAIRKTRVGKAQELENSGPVKQHVPDVVMKKQQDSALHMERNVPNVKHLAILLEVRGSYSLQLRRVENILNQLSYESRGGNAVEAINNVDGNGGSILVENFPGLSKYLRQQNVTTHSLAAPQRTLVQFREALHDAVELGHLYTVVATREDDEPGPSTRHASTFVSRRIYGYQALVHARRALATAKVHCNSEECGFLFPVQNAPRQYDVAMEAAVAAHCGVLEIGPSMAAQEAMPWSLKEAFLSGQSAVAIAGCLITNSTQFLNQSHLHIHTSFIRPCPNATIPRGAYICHFAIGQPPSTAPPSDYELSSTRRGSLLVYDPQIYDGHNIGRFVNKGIAIEKHTHNQCQYCRMQKCVAVGMNIEDPLLTSNESTGAIAVTVGTAVAVGVVGVAVVGIAVLIATRHARKVVLPVAMLSYATLPEKNQYSTNDSTAVDKNYLSVPFSAHMPAPRNGDFSCSNFRYSDQEYEADDYCCLTQQNANMCAFNTLLGRESSIVIVISPLKALMKDQVASLSSKDVVAAYVDADTLPDKEKIKKVHRGQLSLLFISPELLLLNLAFREMLRTPTYMNIVAFVIDEAHCVTKWGNHFRREFTNLGEVRSLIPNHVHVMALTATATERTIARVSAILGLVAPKIITVSPDKSNICYWVKPRGSSHLEIQVILRLLHLWSTKTPVGKAQDEVKVGSATAVDWYNYIRDICIQFFIDHPAVVGGPGKEVEIDESKFGKRKYNRGRAVEGHWVFGGMERAFWWKWLAGMLQHCSPLSLSMFVLEQQCTAMSGLHTISCQQRQATFTSQ
eukprot:Em0001g3668a